ncbi:hypothetical protein H6H02_20195 [Coleofasciculus sp. FACHB-1120]|nr:hypothetical protein [Coleofasciculus sp. FACHB-1120]
MPEIVEIPIKLTRFQLPLAVLTHLQSLLDRQDKGHTPSQAERQEAEGFVELAWQNFTMLFLPSTWVMKQA